MKIHKWRTIGDERLVTTPVFDLYRRRATNVRRGERDFFILTPPAWVNIIPLTPSGHVMMIRQWRHGIGGFTLEIPGGMVDPEDRNPRAAARREMIEESGYDSSRIVALGRVHPNPAIQPNYCYSFLARGVRQVTIPTFDGDEEADVVAVPIGEVGRLITSGRITHALVIAAFAFFDLRSNAERKTPARRRR
jgi:8-oxo-dGTP pyrophosphatase MutT (NUDIX family)